MWAPNHALVLFDEQPIVRPFRILAYGYEAGHPEKKGAGFLLRRARFGVVVIRSVSGGRKVDESSRAQDKHTTCNKWPGKVSGEPRDGIRGRRTPHRQGK